jgi:GDP-L-fucose synthase
MKKNSKIYIAGHNGMVGSGIIRNLKSKGYGNLVFISSQKYNLINQQIVNDFFQKEQPDYVINAAAKVGGILTVIMMPFINSILSQIISKKYL